MENEAETRRTGTVDINDARRFESLATQWWDERGQFATLHAFNPVRLAFILEEVKTLRPSAENSFRPLQGLSFLDIGCGGGILSEPLARLGATVTGIDPVASAIDVAKTHALSQGLEISYRCNTAEDLAVEGKSFDVIVASEVIEHVADVPLFLKSCRSMMRPSGLIVISTLNRTVKSYALAILGAEYILGVIPRGTHDWRKFITPQELDGLLVTAGFAMHRKIGLIYNPLSKTFKTSRSDLSVNYIVSAKAL